MACIIPYIPTHLHWEGRPTVQTFTVGEHLYRRSPPEEVVNPFHTLQIVDVSVNRRGPVTEAAWCAPTDVLLNFTPHKYPDMYLGGKSVPLLLLSEHLKEGYYIREIEQERQEAGHLVKHSCKIALRHRPEDCNYAHCAFEIYYDGVEVTHANYSQNLSKNTGLRTWCKQQLALLLERREVWIMTSDGPASESLPTPTSM